MSKTEENYFLVANDEKGLPFIWGFFFKTLEKARKHLLPDTWVIDMNGNIVARHGDK